MRLSFYRFIAWLTRLTLGKYLRVEATGLENLPANGPFIMASNHKSTLDPILLLAYTINRMEIPVAPAATQGLFVGPLGWFLRGLGAIEIDRVNNRNLGSVRRLIRQLRRGPVLIFPEGGIHDGDGVRDAKVGVGYLARRTGVDVVPVAVVGTDRCLPKGGRFIRRGPVLLAFGQPLQLGYDLDDQNRAQLIMNAVQDLVDNHKSCQNQEQLVEI